MRTAGYQCKFDDQIFWHRFWWKIQLDLQFWSALQQQRGDQSPNLFWKGKYSRPHRVGLTNTNTIDKYKYNLPNTNTNTIDHIMLVSQIQIQSTNLYKHKYNRPHHVGRRFARKFGLRLGTSGLWIIGNKCTGMRSWIVDFGEEWGWETRLRIVDCAKILQIVDHVNKNEVGKQDCRLWKKYCGSWIM